ncbi:MAG: zinc ribbon domain-containing protein [Oscillospiraceae bacterium]|nr:zinc ribbon domain-containing protein [Oscillospiraceae bacterium]
MPFCNNCGQENPNGIPVCQKCGAPMMQPAYNAPMPNQAKPKKKKNVLLIVLLVVGGVIVLGAVSSAGSKKKNQDSGSVTIESGGSSDSSGSANQSSAASSASGFSYEITDTDFQYYTNSIGSVEYYGYVEITNTGSTNIYLKDCTFDLEDNDGHLLQSDNFISSCPDIIAPGEKGYFYNGIGASGIDDSVSLDNGIKLVPQYKLEEATGSIVDYQVSDTDMRTDDYGYVKITGRVTNNTDEDDSMLYVQFLFYDSSGKVLAISGTTILDLTAGSTQSFEGSTMFANDTVSIENVAEYKVIARKTYYQW